MNSSIITNPRSTSRLPVALILVLLAGASFVPNASGGNLPTGAWTPARSMTTPRAGACAAQLQDGRILVIGGEGAGVLFSVEAYDAAGQFTEVSPLSIGRSQHACAVLADGRVLVAGGLDPYQGAQGSVEIYDPNADAWSLLPQGMAQPRFRHTATLLEDGRVLIAGGEGLAGATNALELFDPASGTVATMTVALGSPRTAHAATLLIDGRVLITGGGVGAEALATAEIVDPLAQSISQAPEMSSPRAGHTSTRLPDGRVLIAGGNDGQADLASAEIYDADAGAVHDSLSSLAAPRRSHMAFLLPANNNVLITGGVSGQDDLSTAELYAEWTDTFASTGPMASPHTAGIGSPAVSPGSLLVAGGGGQSDAELYGYATLESDRSDYAPGDPIIIEGTGWEPGETVTLTFNEVPYTHLPEVVYATADADGHFVNADYSPQEHDLGVHYYLVAIGGSSQAQIEFTDAAQPTATALTSTLPNPSAFGQAGTLTATVTRVGGGSHPTCGSVTFRNNGSVYDVVTLTISNIATTSTASLPMGSDDLVAEYTPAASGCNYEASTSNTINQIVATGSIVVTPDDTSRSYGSANPVFTGTLTGVAPGDNITATYDSAATASSPVRGYPIVPTLLDPDGKLGNYAVTINNGTLTVGAAPLSVTGAGAARTYGDVNPAFGGTLTGVVNGDNITATYDSAATASSPVGAYPIVPTLLDPDTKLGNYAVTSIDGSLTVDAAALSVTGDDAARDYGAANPVFGGTFTGVVNGDNITATYDSPATASSPVGGYAIVPTLADPDTKLGNYTITATNGTLTVSAVALNVTADDAARAYGAANPVFGGTLTGVVNGDNITATYVSPATASSPVGGYAIVPTLADPDTKLGNYIVTINNGTLTVGAGTLYITANSTSRTYGHANPPLTGTITGLFNGDNITATYASAATLASPVGAYSIVPTPVDPGNKLGNYTVVITNGTLTVDPAPLTVTAGGDWKLYGSSNPACTGTVSGVMNGDNITATYSSPATSASAVGNYSIVPGLVDPDNKAGNYTVTLNNGNLAVIPTALVVIASSSTRAYGLANPVLTGLVLGVMNGDDITATYASAATPASPAGSYSIVPTLVDPGNKLGNYNVISVNGTLSVTIQPLAITQPLNAQVLSCSPGATPPTIDWLAAQYDKYKVFIGLDPGFRKRISSGSSWLRTASWNVPMKKWKSLCAASAGAIYLKVQGLDLNTTKKDPTRRLFGPTTVSTTQ